MGYILKNHYISGLEKERKKESIQALEINHCEQEVKKSIEKDMYSEKKNIMISTLYRS